ncbi:MAG: SDR family oxidoreductase [Pararhodobacter sp.]
MQDLFGTTSLIVGGSSGIGRAMAGLVVARGGEVILAARRRQMLDRAVEELGAAARAQMLDVTDPAAIRRLATSLAPASVDHLFVTAATLAHGPFASQPIDAVQTMFQSKFWGAYALCQAMLPRMRAGGSITLVSGVLSRRPAANCAALGAACAAIEALARGLALELGPGLRVNCIAPGMVRSALHDNLPDARRQAVFSATGASLPAGRIGKPCEIAQAAIMAATNGYMTGAVIDIDGGHMVRQYASAV